MTINVPLVIFDELPITSGSTGQAYHLIALPDLWPAKLLKRWLSLIFCLAASAAFSGALSGKCYQI
jgi:hypothetical protein